MKCISCCLQRQCEKNINVIFFNLSETTFHIGGIPTFAPTFRWLVTGEPVLTGDGENLVDDRLTNWLGKRTIVISRKQYNFPIQFELEPKPCNTEFAFICQQFPKEFWRNYI